MTIEIHMLELEALIMQRMESGGFHNCRRGSPAGVEIVAARSGAGRKHG